MIENARIYTGDPVSVQKQVREYLASHPNATVLSSSIAVVPPIFAATLEHTAKPATKQAKKPAEQPAAKIAPIPEHQPQTHICVIVGLAL